MPIALPTEQRFDKLIAIVATSNQAKQRRTTLMSTNTVSTPTHERCVTSYAARTQYKPGVVHPPHIKVKDAIDIHCHAHEGPARSLRPGAARVIGGNERPAVQEHSRRRSGQSHARRPGRRQSLGGKRRCYADYLLVELRVRPADGADLGEDGERNDRSRHRRGLAAGVHPRHYHEHGRHLRHASSDAAKRHWLGRADALG